MSSEPEVHFCNVCNQSIPETALESGAAIRVEGRIVPLATPELAGGRGAVPSRSGLVAAVLVLLIAVVGAVIYVDWRMTESEGRVRGQVSGLSQPLAEGIERLDAIDRRLGQTAVGDDLVPLRSAVDDARELVRADVKELQDELAVRTSRIAELERLLQRAAEGQIQQSARLTLMQDELRALARDMAELRARPAFTPPSPVVGGVGDGVAPGAAAGTGLPPEIAHHVARLSDPDDGTRFEAVDQLLQADDERVYPHLVPLAKDPDMFVRRLVLEGLADHHDASSVEALLDALADAEEVVRHTAYLGLKRLTGQEIEFDPGARADQRTAMQRRWRRWWDDAKDSF